ncbi:MAG: enoyl-CoA hydratase/isomerase family protein [Pseudomonadota bacterium]
MEQDEIRFEHIGNAGIVTLNRPQALNAVTHDMVLKLQAQLDRWRNVAEVRHVIIKAVPGKAFSAGGDIRHLYERGVAGDPDFQFFHDEYRLNAYIKAYPKPYVALIDGIAMGGGVGVSFHGSHRVVGDRMSFAMPEVGIGFFPDVGGSFFLSRMPEGAGMYLGLTGERIKAGDAVWGGLATHYVPSDQFEALEAALCEITDVDACLRGFHKTATQGQLVRHHNSIKAAFSPSVFDEIFPKLDEISASGDKSAAEWVEATKSTILQKCPLSVKIAFRQIRDGGSRSMEECMRMEYRILRRVLSGTQFYEGIRAAIIDKDNAPKWRPETLDDVSDAEIDENFASLDDQELSFQ